MAVLEGGMSLIKKRDTGADDLGSHEYRGGRSEQVGSLKKAETADLTAGNHAAGIWQAIQPNFGAFDLIGGHNTDGRMRFSQFDHAPDAIRKQPVVGLYHLAILAIRRNASKGEIVILYLGKEALRPDEAELIRKARSIAFGDFCRSISAAIVHKNVFQILVSLPQNAFDALAQVFSSVIEGRYNANESCGFHVVLL